MMVSGSTATSTDERDCGDGDVAAASRDGEVWSQCTAVGEDQKVSASNQSSKMHCYQRTD